MKKKVSIGQKWGLSEKLGQKLGVAKSDVFYYLFDEADRLNLINSALEGGAEALEAIRNFPGWKSCKANTPDSKEVQIKLTMWYVKQVGSIERAKKLLNAAEAMMNLLEEDDGQIKERDKDSVPDKEETAQG